MIGAAKCLLLIFIASTVIGCAIGQHSQYTGGIQFVPNKVENAPSIIVTVIDQRPELLSGNISESNIGILRSLAGIPWAVIHLQARHWQWIWEKASCKRSIIMDIKRFIPIFHWLVP